PLSLLGVTALAVDAPSAHGRALIAWITGGSHLATLHTVRVLHSTRTGPIHNHRPRDPPRLPQVDAAAPCVEPAAPEQARLPQDVERLRAPHPRVPGEDQG